MHALAACVALDLLAQLAQPIPPAFDAAAWKTLKIVDGVTLKRAAISPSARSPRPSSA